MNDAELKLLKDEFKQVLSGYKELFAELNADHSEFLKKYPIKQIKNMTISDYVIGKDNSFCYWLEQRLDKLGRIRGGSPADKKFGVYYGKTKYDSTMKFRFIKKWGNTYDEAFDNVKNEIIHLIDAAKKNRIDEIEKNTISPLFKGKILSTYFPKKFINIFSIDHVDHFIESLGIFYDYSLNNTIERKKQILLNFKNRDDYFKTLTNYEFTAFLYNKLTPLSETKNNNYEVVYPPIETIKISVIDLTVNKLNVSIENKSNINRSNNGFDETLIKRIGNRGELIVFNYEIDYLTKNNRKDLAKKVKDVSKNNYGYDILSYNLDGTEKYIEVKSTTSKPPLLNFYITKNEHHKSKETDNYYFYIVFEVNKNNPKIFIFNPFKKGNQYYELIPIQYLVKVNTL